MSSSATEGIFYEAVTNQILDDLVAACQPRRMTVVGDFSARGGITTTVTATYEAEPGSGRSRGMRTSDAPRSPSRTRSTSTPSSRATSLGRRGRTSRAAHEAGLREVRLIHGRGNGVQRGIVQAVLEKHPLVEAFQDAPEPPGRDGRAAGLGVSAIDAGS